MEHIDNKGANNRAENLHQPIRRYEKKMPSIKSPGAAQQFLIIQSATYNIFYIQRRLLNRTTFKQIPCWGAFSLEKYNCSSLNNVGESFVRLISFKVTIPVDALMYDLLWKL